MWCGVSLGRCPGGGALSYSRPAKLHEGVESELFCSSSGSSSVGSEGVSCRTCCSGWVCSPVLGVTLRVSRVGSNWKVVVELSSC